MHAPSEEKAAVDAAVDVAVDVGPGGHDDAKLERILKVLEGMHAPCIRALEVDEETTVGHVREAITGVVERLHRDASSAYGSVRVLRDVPSGYTGGGRTSGGRRPGDQDDPVLPPSHVLAVYSKNRKLWSVRREWFESLFPVVRGVLPATGVSHLVVARLVILAMVTRPESHIRLQRSPPGYVFSPSGKLYMCSDSE